MRKPNLVLSYVFLVGTPLLMLLGILDAGRGLTAPAHVGGAWVVEADFSRLAGAPCGELLTAGHPLILNILQSGTDILSSFDSSQRTTFSGVLDGTTLRVGSPGPFTARNGDGRCNNGISMTATLDRQAGQISLVGMLTMNSCRECSPVSFRATRRTPPRDGGGR